MEQVPSVDRYAPLRHVLALSPQEASPEEVSPLRLSGWHLLDLRVQLGNSQQGKHVFLVLCAFSVVKTRSPYILELKIAWELLAVSANHNSSKVVKYSDI